MLCVLFMSLLDLWHRGHLCAIKRWLNNLPVLIFFLSAKATYIKKNNLGESGLTMAYSTQPIHPSFQCNMQSSLASATSNIPEIFGRYIYNCTFHVDCSLWKWRSRCFAGKTSFCSLRPPVIRWFWLVWILFDVSAYITHCARACRCRPFALIAGGSV